MTLKSSQMMNDISYIRSFFLTKKDKTDRLLFEHAVDTADILHDSLTRSGEIIGCKNFDDMWRSALGHDLLEDTTVTKEELEKKWGIKVVSLIIDLTNAKGDGNVSGYIEKLQHVPEEAAILKLCDIVSNANNSVKCTDKASKEWFTNFWIPLLESYNQIFRKRKFVLYPKTAMYLCDIIRSQTQLLTSLIIDTKNDRKT